MVKPKRTRKLLVYLDQNFLSEMSKADINENVRPEFKEIYELLHEGFISEKLVVPQSRLHDVETSLASHLKDRIVSYQNYLGQVDLYRPEEIESKQIAATFEKFMGRPADDPLTIRNGFVHDPDQRVQRLAVVVDAHLENLNLRDERLRTAKLLENLRQQIVRDNRTYDAQLKIEQKTWRDQFLKSYQRLYRPATEDNWKPFIAFAESSEFKSIPLPSLSAQLFATILAKCPQRPIKSSDTTDINVISAYLPYMDVFCTDAFMAEQLRALGIDRRYGVAVFNGRTQSLAKLKLWIEGYLGNAEPIRRPSITAFVFPPKHDRDNSFQFHRRLGDALRAMGIREYGEIYAFDDGDMPHYKINGTDLPAPFYGLQDVISIKIHAGASEEDLLRICRERCRSDAFLVIDHYKDISDTLMLGAAMAAESGGDFSNGYRVYRTKLEFNTSPVSESTK